MVDRNGTDAERTDAPVIETYDTAVQTAALRLAAQSPTSDDRRAAEVALARAISQSSAGIAAYIIEKARRSVG